jgi:glutamate dehydrogenase
MGFNSPNRLLPQLLELLHERVTGARYEQIKGFAEKYYRDIAAEDIADLVLEDLYGALLSHWAFARQRPRGGAKVRALNPFPEENGWQSPHTVIEIVAPDRPFLVQSIIMEVNRHGLTNHLVHHPVFDVTRTEAGLLTDSNSQSAYETCTEAFVHIEVDRQSDSDALAGLTSDIDRILKNVIAATDDWRHCKKRIENACAVIRSGPKEISEEAKEDAVAFLQWLAADHFVFLGYRDYEIDPKKSCPRFRIVPGTGLGVLRDSLAPIPPPEPVPLSRDACAVLCRKTPLIITKATSRSTVQRPVFMDYIGVKRFAPNGRMIGELRFLGLYSASAYRAELQQIPLVRHKVDDVFQRSGFSPDSHNGRALMHVLEDLPRDELFHSNVDELYDCAMGVLQLQERQRVRIFLRQDVYGQFLSVLVFVPRERYHTELRRKLTRTLMEALGGKSFEFKVQLSEFPLARIHFIIHTGPCDAKKIDVKVIEHSFVDALYEWKDGLKEALLSHFGEEEGNRLFNNYCSGISVAYKEDFDPRAAVVDLDHIERLNNNDIAIMLYQPLAAQNNTLRFKLYCSDRPAALSDVLPMLENMGVRVLDEKPYEISNKSGRRFWIHDFGLFYGGRDSLEIHALKTAFQDAFENIWFARVENDGFNRLVLKANLDWRRIAVLRAFYFFLRQIGMAFSQAYVEQTLSHNPRIAEQLMRLFEGRFDPTTKERTRDAQRIAETISDAIDQVESLDEDRILRRYLNLIQAIVRCNYYQQRHDHLGIPYFSFKFDPSNIQGMPDPKPCFEIFVYSPRVEGVHLRGGLVARGGLRWSDRREDFRTEVLGLMKAQMSKNAVIVPTGAKGGFVAKRLHRLTGRKAIHKEVAHCYSIFIKALLDLTDNLDGIEVVKPNHVVCYDGDDPYLVVAADKGTATFSDTANRIAHQYQFWLGDAFASGGSSGYDHKKMGITARGAWESIKRHFIELGTDIQTTPFTVIGIGDMSGDVFGNGMLLSDKIRLLGAFNHRHIFLDPDPDPLLSFKERQYLFECPHSSWDDYDRNRISKGGGVYSRTVKSISLSPQVRTILAVKEKRLTPNALIRAMLAAPVDLLWNGGIGTYVKAHDEPNERVGDRANDSVRVDARTLHCKVVAEGGNLGFTQRGRIEFAAEGGRINTDSVDNSAGVDCSDHEVNIKIPLDRIIRQGQLTRKQRDQLLEAMTAEVMQLVLRNNALQTCGISLVEAEAAETVPLHRRAIQLLEQRGYLNRVVEAIPSDDELAERGAQGKGLFRPEIAVLMAYGKILLKDDLLSNPALLNSDLLVPTLPLYFPRRLRERYPQAIRSHRLRNEITANQLVNSLVNRLGPSFAFRMMDEAGTDIANVVYAYRLALEVFDIQSIWHQIESLEVRVEPGVQLDMMILVRRVMERAMFWLQRHLLRAKADDRKSAEFRSGIASLSSRVMDLMPESEQQFARARIEQLMMTKVPQALAERIATLNTLFSLLDVIAVHCRSKRPLLEVAQVHFALDEQLELSWLRTQISLLEQRTYWQSLARSALRDEFHAGCQSLIDDVTRRRTGSPTQMTEAWRKKKRAAIERYQKLLGAIQTDSPVEFEKMVVLLRALHAIVG